MSWSRSARRRPRSRSCTKARAWPRTCAAAAAGKPSPTTSIAPRATRRIWNGRPRAWCIGRETIGPHTARLFERIMADKPHPEMGYRGCLGIIRLAGKYSHAARGSRRRAGLAHRRVPLQKRRIDPEELARPAAPAIVTAARCHRHRTTTSAERSTSNRRAHMLQEPMMEKLTAMRLLGMVDALKTQEQDPASRELSFLERLGLLVDQQWTWRENQALARRLHAAKLKGACVEEIDYRTARGLDKSVIRALAQKSAWVAQSRKHLRARTHRRGQELRRLRAGAEGLPRWILGAVHARRGAVPRSGHRARRRQPAQLAGASSAASMCW